MFQNRCRYSTGEKIRKIYRCTGNPIGRTRRRCACGLCRIKKDRLAPGPPDDDGIVLAVPVASRLAASRLEGAVDELIYVLIPDEFQGVEGFYEDYHRIRDQEMFEYLDKCREESLPV
jgi:hypothetical protein